jgi:hypothetical protein
LAADVYSARRDWEDAHRRLENEMRDPRRKEQLLRQVEVVSDELRKRIGARFTLRELVDEYHQADVWARHAVSERAPAQGWPRTLSLVEGAAFHVYSRGAEDYRP